MFGGFHERFWKGCLPLHTLIPLAFEEALNNSIVFQFAQGTGRAYTMRPPGLQAPRAAQSKAY